MITLHSFLTWGNKACNFNGNRNTNQFITMNLDGSLMIPMTTNVNKSGGYLEVIVSEVMCFGWQVWSGRVRDDSVSSRLGRRFVTTCIHYRFISDTLPLSSIRLWHYPIYIGIGMAVFNPQLGDHTKRVITLKWSH